MLATSLPSALFMADTCLVLSQRNAEWCGHGPVLEQDIAITNITLDLVGQSRLFYQYAAEIMNATEGTNHTEDSLAFHRDERAFKNLLIGELPKGDWAHTILRQFLFSSYQELLFEKWQAGNDERLAAIAEKSLKEIRYHIKWSSEWVIRLGDGTEESKTRMNQAIQALWPYTGEFFESTAGDPVEMSALKQPWTSRVASIFEEATLSFPADCFMQTGGKTGKHTEHLGFMLAEMQYLQRAYPNATW
ncbi:MAG: 1,2-phenylacetyl-CoA epoxidase subunit PaaC [Ferruginibacter sp.]